MIHLDRVLFPTDGSDCAEHARHHAAYLADRFEAALHVIHVEERDVELTDVIDIREADVLDDLHDVIRGEETLVAEPRTQEHRVVHRSAAGGILSYAAEHDANLIVLGTHGRTGVRRLVLGSVAEEVVRRAPVPVMTVGQEATAPDEMEEGHLLVPVDFSEQQPRLLAHARELALAYDMTLTLLHVVERESLPEVYEAYADPPEPGALAERVEAALDERAADLLAIATHGRSGVERMLMGSVAEKVIRRAPCPVFTVKSFGQSLVRESENGAN
jgi:nucleotide-binding universal stress UspA family protein